MKKRRFKRKKLGIKGLFFIFIISLFTIGTGYSLLSENLIVTGEAKLVKQSNPELNLSLTYNKSVWGTNPYTIQYDVKLKNNSNKVVNGWEIYINLNEDNISIENCWNVKCSIENNKLILENVDYNQNIGIDGELTFGVQLKSFTNDINFDDFYAEEDNPETDDNEIIDADDIMVTYNKTNSWNDNNYTYQIYDATITNNGDSIITSWKVELNRKNTSLDTAWNCNYIEKSQVFIFSNQSYNGTIEPKKSITFSFIIKSKNKIDIDTKNIYVVR